MSIQLDAEVLPAGMLHDLVSAASYKSSKSNKNMETLM